MAIGLAACGGEGESPDPPARSAAAERAHADAAIRAHNAQVREEYQRRRRAEVPTVAERSAKRTADDFYAILAADRAPKDPDRTVIDSYSFCELMSKQAVAQTVRYAKVSSGLAGEWDCESAIELLVLRAKRTGDLKTLEGAEVIGVNARGDRATATVRFGEGPATSLPMVREEGEWKLAATPVGGES